MDPGLIEKILPALIGHLRQRSSKTAFKLPERLSLIVWNNGCQAGNPGKIGKKHGPESGFYAPIHTCTELILDLGFQTLDLGSGIFDPVFLSANLPIEAL